MLDEIVVRVFLYGLQIILLIPVSQWSVVSQYHMFWS